jgi:transposase
MGKPLGDDLRRKLLYAYDQGEGTLAELAGRFLVSEGWAKKISAARNRTGQAERVPHCPGRKPHADDKVQQQVRCWFVRQPDLTLAEVQQKLLGEADVRLSLPQVWHLLQKLGLRLKNGRSTPPGKIPKPIASSAKSLLPVLRRARRNTRFSATKVESRPR